MLHAQRVAPSSKAREHHQKAQSDPRRAEKRVEDRRWDSSVTDDTQLIVSLAVDNKLPIPVLHSIQETKNDNYTVVLAKAWSYGRSN